VTTCAYAIVGGDYDRAGGASRRLKEALKSVGADAQAIRRVMIASYEAEMNVVIHAQGGTLAARFDECRVEVEVRDEGPGIADISLAMREGYSTAPPEARALGFGAGLGLPNIKKHTDSFTIESQVGAGTRLVFSIALQQQAGSKRLPRSMCLQPDRCKACLRCVTACPTEAIRMRRDGPTILGHLCIECGACVGLCAAHAVTMEEHSALPWRAARTCLLVPSAFLAACGTGHDEALRALAACGFDDVCSLAPWEEALSIAVRAHAEAQPEGGVLISPCCAAVVDLIESRFTPLLGRLAPFASPIEAAFRVSGTGARIVAMCPAERSLLLAAGVPAGDVVSCAALRQRLVAERSAYSALLPSRVTAGSGRATQSHHALVVFGMRDVLQALEAVESGSLDDVDILEAYACDHGCLGSGVLGIQQPALMNYRWRADSPSSATARALNRQEPYAERIGMRLDDDMSKAIVKLGRINSLLAELPGRDCARCGAPSCRALAEDVVLARAAMRDCPYLDNQEAPR
jgi:serine/threonine-protein kinase RsbT